MKTATDKKRSWGQFSVKTLFLATLLVGTFLAGRLSVAPQLNALRQQAHQERARAEANFHQAMQLMDQRMVEQSEAQLRQNETVNARVRRQINETIRRIADESRSESFDSKP